MASPPPPRPKPREPGAEILRRAIEETVKGLDPARVGDALAGEGKARWVNDPDGDGLVLIDREDRVRLALPDGRPMEKPGRIKPPPTAPVALAEYAAEISRGEGFSPHLYLDTANNVTVGIGEFVPSEDAALAYEWRDRGTGRVLGRTPAEVAWIKRSYRAVQSAPKRRPAPFYRDLTTIDITRAHAEALRDQKINQFLANLRRIFPDFPSFPAEAKLALMDMIYTLGARGLTTDFDLMVPAIRRRRWAVAAEESRRKPEQVGAARNRRVKDLLLRAEASDIHAPRSAPRRRIRARVNMR